MKRSVLNSLLVGAVLLTGVVVCDTAAAQGFGSLKGRFVFEGTAPQLDLLVKKGDKSVKDGEVCSAEDLPNELLVVDSATNGIRDVFVYLAKKPETVAPGLATPAEVEVVMDQKNCQFLPHALVIRTDQKVRVLNDDAVLHNTRATPTKNASAGFNNSIAPKDRKGLSIQGLKLAEKVPFDVNCDVHPWMIAHWLVVDHPYATVSSADGSFEIQQLPAGDHEFRFWHKATGYTPGNKETGWDGKGLHKITIKADGVTDLGEVKVPLAAFKALKK